MDEARCGATSQLVNGCAAHASHRLLTRHLKTCSLVTLFTTSSDGGGKLGEYSDKSGPRIGNLAESSDKVETMELIAHQKRTLLRQ